MSPKRQKQVANRNVTNSIMEDGINELPDDILVSIISNLKMEEAMRTSILSHRWTKLWTNYTGSLDFSNIELELPADLDDEDLLKEWLDKEKSRYVRWVN